MNKEQAKKLQKSNVVSDKKTNELFAVVKVETEDNKTFLITVENETNKKVYKHIDLNVESNLVAKDVIKKKEPAVTVGRKPREPKYEIKSGEIFTQEDYDKMGSNAKRNVIAENTVVFLSDVDGIYISKTVGSSDIYEIPANSLNNAKKVRNNI